MRELLLIVPTLNSSFWTVTIQTDRKDETACLLDYTIAKFSSAGSNLWDHYKVQFTVALPDQTQEIL
jgi:hypothetical protein